VELNAAMPFADMMRKICCIALTPVASFLALSRIAFLLEIPWNQSAQVVGWGNAGDHHHWNN